MEQFRQIGEALGSLKSVMVFRDSIQINQRQCCLMFDVFNFAYECIADEIIQNLKFEEKTGKWKVLEQPLREIHRIFKEGESYVRHCMETKDWWAKAITMCHNRDCVEFHIHNLLCCMPVVIEAIESAGETSGWDQDEMQRKRLINSNKYRKEYRDMKLFQWKFGKQYLITQDLCNRYDTVWKEDRWFLYNKIHEKKVAGITKHEKKLIDFLLRILERSESLEERLLPSSILIGSKDYQVRRRMGNMSQYKEISWLGESFVIRHFSGDIEALVPEIRELLSLSHPNIMDYLCGFTDEEKKECFLLMELMSKTLSTHIKEIHGPRRRIPFLLHVAVDIMLQIARGMEYMHSKKVYHGELNPSNILVKSRGTSPEGYLHAKVSGFGLSSVKDLNQRGNTNTNTNTNQNGTLPFIWYSPEVLEEQEQSGGAANSNSKYTEKSDVYSFGMVCFELLTGKVPFEDSHLQGEKMSRNIRAGERPLFPLNSPKYVINLTKRCWHIDPNQRPTFSTICRVLRYIKRFLAMNPGYINHPEQPVPPVDYCDIEAVLLRKFPSWGSSESSPVSIIPFQMFAYQVIEREKISTCLKDNSESGSETSACGDELVTSGDEPFPSTNERKSLLGHDSIMNRKITLTRKSLDLKFTKQPSTPKGKSARPPQMSPRARSLRLNSDNRIISSPRAIRRVSSGHVSDSELS
ncbi:mitogen-activated protein kinase kinase kinase 7 [Cajanus cajan]|uniref:Light-sensor Protein kinase n=1 Tax=Cajanus cajan TaxID=3821 RepID=A0A151SND9_CAJCA|nr:mitogen-activated protein kinase kinase kinase 7 [Cajanus cajan]KYP56337.1 Light-sensor Protein kinase [Cajanus cajan]